MFTPVSLDSLVLMARPVVGGTEFHRIILPISDRSQTLALPLHYRVQTTPLSLSLFLIIITEIFLR